MSKNTTLLGAIDDARRAIAGEAATFRDDSKRMGRHLVDSTAADHPKVVELRELSQWSEGQVWSCPERHGAITGVMKTQIDWIPLSIGAVLRR